MWTLHDQTQTLALDPHVPQSSVVSHRVVFHGWYLGAISSVSTARPSYLHPACLRALHSLATSAVPTLPLHLGQDFSAEALLRPEGQVQACL